MTSTIMDDSVEYGTPANAQSPGANAILAQPPLSQSGEGSEGIHQSFRTHVTPITDAIMR